MLDASNHLLRLNCMTKRVKKPAGTSAGRTLSPIAIAFAARVAEIRKAKKLTRIQLAELAEVSRQFVWELEEKKKEPTLTSAAKIAEALDTTLRDMLPRE